MSIEVSLYKQVENQEFYFIEELVIESKLFDNAEFIDNKITFTFRNCKFKTLFIRNNSQIDFKDISILFSYCEIENIYVENIQTDNISILFSNSIISGLVNSNKIKSVSIFNCILKNTFFIIDVRKVDISYDERNINFYKWENFLTKYKINISNFKEYKFYIYDFENFVFYVDPIEEDKEEKEEKLIKFIDEQIKISLKLNYKLNNEDKKTKILNANLCSLEINGYSNGDLLIENSKIDNIYLQNFSSKNGCNFYNIQPLRQESERKFQITRCNMKNFWFDNVLFNQYKLISFYRNKFDDTIFTSCEFPSDYKDFEKFVTVENIHYPNKKDNSYDSLRYETFLQLKKCVENSGNFFESLKFQSIANESLLKIKGIPYWDRIILYFNKFSNNHGTSIINPLLLIFGFSITFYVLYLNSLNLIFNKNSQVDWNLLGYFFSFLDLTHRTDFLVEKVKLNGWAIFFDYLNKIFVGYLVYQFIAAFRKYGKSQK